MIVDICGTICLGLMIISFIIGIIAFIIDIIKQKRKINKKQSVFPMKYDIREDWLMIFLSIGFICGLITGILAIWL